MLNRSEVDDVFDGQPQHLYNIIVEMCVVFRFAKWRGLDGSQSVSPDDAVLRVGFRRV